MRADRDFRREYQLVGGTNRKRMVTYHVDPAAANDQLTVCPAIGLYGRPIVVCYKGCMQRILILCVLID